MKNDKETFVRYLEYLDINRELVTLIDVVNQADMQQNGIGAFHIEYRNGPMDELLAPNDPHLKKRMSYPHLVLMYDGIPVHVVAATGYQMDSISPVIAGRVRSQLYSHMIARLCIFGAIQSRDDVFDRGYPYVYKIMNNSTL